MNASEIILHVREAGLGPDLDVGGTAYGIRVALGLTFVAVLLGEYRGRAVVAKKSWSTWMLLISGAALLIASILNARSLHLGYGRHLDTIPRAVLGPLTTLSRVADTLVSLSTLSSKLFLASVLYPSSGSAHRKLIQAATLLTSLTAIPVVVLASLPVERLYCEPDRAGNGCYPVESWLALTGFAAGFSSLMNIALVGVSLRVMLTRRNDLRDRSTEALAIACGAGAFIASIVRMAKYAPLETGDFTYYGGRILLWGVIESSLTIVSGSTMAPHTSRERIKRSRSPPTTTDESDSADGARLYGGLVCDQETGDVGRVNRSEALYRTMVRSGLL